MTHSREKSVGRTLLPLCTSLTLKRVNSGGVAARICRFSATHVTRLKVLSDQKMEANYQLTVPPVHFHPARPVKVDYLYIARPLVRLLLVKNFRIEKRKC